MEYLLLKCFSITFKANCLATAFIRFHIGGMYSYFFHRLVIFRCQLKTTTIKFNWMCHVRDWNCSHANCIHTCVFDFSHKQSKSSFYSQNTIEMLLNLTYKIPPSEMCITFYFQFVQAFVSAIMNILWTYHYDCHCNILAAVFLGVTTSITIKYSFGLILPFYHWIVAHFSFSFPHVRVDAVCTCVRYIKFKSTPTTLAMRQMIKNHFTNESQTPWGKLNQTERRKKKIYWCA